MTPGPLLQRVHELEDRIQRATLAPDEVARERQRALTDAENARQALRVHYARGDSDAKQERRLRDAVDAAEVAAEARWDERLAGARMAQGVARDDLRAFVREHFAQLAAELLPTCLEADARFTEARATYVAAVTEKRALLDEWAPLIGPVGIPVDDLPDERSLEIPAPRSLAAVAEELVAAQATDVDTG
jgi:F0F1-type ATP synthase membrane subunit b/b'